MLLYSNPYFQMMYFRKNIPPIFPVENVKIPIAPLKIRFQK